MLKFEVGEAHLLASSLSGHQFSSFSEFYMQRVLQFYWPRRILSGMKLKPDNRAA